VRHDCQVATRRPLPLIDPSASEFFLIRGVMWEAVAVTESKSQGDERGPLCTCCRQPLRETLRVVSIDAVREGDAVAPKVEVTFCGACGTTLSAIPLPQPPEPLRVPDPDDPESIEGRFQLRCRELIDEIQVVGFTPGGWIGLIKQHGAVGAARDLLSAGRILPVTRWLVGQGRVDLTMEREITGPQWTDLFDDTDRAEAERRLTQVTGDH
jgi:hypothetical protein